FFPEPAPPTRMRFCGYAEPRTDLNTWLTTRACERPSLGTQELDRVGSGFYRRSRPALHESRRYGQGAIILKANTTVDHFALYRWRREMGRADWNRLTEFGNKGIRSPVGYYPHNPSLSDAPAVWIRRVTPEVLEPDRK